MAALIPEHVGCVRSAAALAAVLLLWSCGMPSPAEDSDEDAASAVRIVTLAPHLVELVFAAGAGEQIVGTVEFSDHPPEASRIPRVGDAFRVDFEAIAALGPDLVLGWPSGNSIQLLQQLERLGYRVIALEPDGVGGIARQIREIGRLAGTVEHADLAAETLEARLRNLRARWAGAEPIRAFVQISARPLLTVSGRHVISEALALCGGVNVFDGLGELAPTVSREAVVAARPDVIIATREPGESEDPRRVLADWLRWERLPAVRDGNLVLVDADLLTRAAPRLLDGIEQLCGRLDAVRPDAGLQEAAMRGEMRVPERLSDSSAR